VSIGRGGLLDRYFYLFMALLVPVVVAYGFSFTIDANLLHPAVTRPPILYVHAAVFSGWLVFFLAQTAAVRARRVAWHRRIGWLGAALGVLVVVLGVATAIVMGRFNTAKLGSTRAETDLIVPLFDMVAFASTFAAAVALRKNPEHHRRLMLAATCALTAAAFGRFPAWLLPPVFFYAGVDALIFLGVARDLVVDRRVHPVYRSVLPAFMAGQALVVYTVVNDLPYWRAIGHALLR
jgi:hypothetical protein